MVYQNNIYNSFQHYYKIYINKKMIVENMLKYLLNLYVLHYKQKIKKNKIIYYKYC